MKIILMLLFMVASANGGERINKIGKVIYSKEARSYYFIYLLEDNKTAFHKIDIKNKSEQRAIQGLVGKSIRVEGDLDFKRGTAEVFSLNEELSIKKMEKFELNVLTFDSNSFYERERYVSHFYEIKSSQSGGGIAVSDTTANSLIATGAVAIGIATGPASLIPAALFGIYEMLL